MINPTKINLTNKVDQFFKFVTNSFSGTYYKIDP